MDGSLIECYTRVRDRPLEDDTNDRGLPLERLLCSFAEVECFSHPRHIAPLTSIVRRSGTIMSRCKGMLMWRLYPSITCIAPSMLVARLHIVKFKAIRRFPYRGVAVRHRERLPHPIGNRSVGSSIAPGQLTPEIPSSDISCFSVAAPLSSIASVPLFPRRVLISSSCPSICCYSCTCRSPEKLQQLAGAIA